MSQDNTEKSAGEGGAGAEPGVFDPHRRPCVDLDAATKDGPYFVRGPIEIEDGRGEGT